MDELIISYLPLQFLQVVIEFFLVNIIQKRCSTIFLDVLSSYRFSLWFIESSHLESVRKHYLDFYNVDRNNQFFKKLFKKQSNVFHGKKCVRCNEFLPSSCSKVIHDSLVRYDAGKNVFEEKPFTYKTVGEIRKYEITFMQHLLDYDFYNADTLVDEFLLNVKNRVMRSSVDFFYQVWFFLIK